jgi:hypothetical protein
MRCLRAASCLVTGTSFCRETIPNACSIVKAPLSCLAVVTALGWPGLADFRFWGSLALGLAVAFVAALPVNRWLIARGPGHAAVHARHGGRNQAA